MRVEIESVTPLAFAGGSPVRAASGIAALGTGWLVAQDDATHAAWWRDGTTEPVRIFAPVEDHDTFEEAAGTKHLKPDLEAACEVDVDGSPSVLLLGSGSSPERMRAALVTLHGGNPEVVHADLTPLYAAVADALGLPAHVLNLEGACVLGSTFRWFHRGLPSAGLPTASVDLDLAELVDAVRQLPEAALPRPRNAARYDLGEVTGVGLAVTDAVGLRTTGDAGPLILVSAAAEDTPDPRNDGPVVGSALTLLDGTRVSASAALPELDGRVCKIEGLVVLEETATTARLIATVDADDPAAASAALLLNVRW